MQNIFKKSFFILKNNLIFIQPLLLCLLLFMTVFAFVIGRNLFIVPKILLLISMLLLFVAFCSGWFYINKFGVLNYIENDSQEEITMKSVQNLKKFFEGVGSDFIKTTIAYFILFIIYTGLLFVIYNLCMQVFGEPKIIYDFPKILNASSQAEILNYLNSITTNDKVVFASWIITINCVTSFMNFFVILYFAILNFEKTNVFKSLWLAVKFFFSNIFSVILIIIFAFVLYVLFNFLSIVLGTNSFSFVILIILFTVYLNYYLLLVFCFYYDKTKDNCNNRTELIG